MTNIDKKPIQVLLVEDNPGDTRLLHFILKRETTREFKLTHVETLSEALILVNEESFDVILLDLSLPDAQGLETVDKIHCEVSDCPIVVLTGTNDEELAVKAVQTGAQDYLVKGQVDSNLMVRAIMYAIERHKVEKRLKEANNSLTEANEKAMKMMAELKVTQNELKLALDMTKEADRLKNEFLANTSHELRTPLNSIIGSLQLIRDDMCDSKDEEKDFISTALKSASHLLQLINDILDIAKIEAGNIGLSLETFNLQDVFDEVYIITHIQAEEKKIDLKFEMGKNNKISIYADYQKVKQVLLSLIGNSIKFTSKGSIIVLASAISDKRIAKIQIIDTGSGIDPAKQKVVFNTFIQEDSSSSRRFGGTGLGLSLSKRLLELMEGDIELTSPGKEKGTKVTITLPLSEKMSETSLETAQSGEKKRIYQAISNKPNKNIRSRTFLE